jgi:hypothetical protein
LTGRATKRAPGAGPAKVITVRAEYAIGKGGLPGFNVAIGQAL